LIIGENVGSELTVPYESRDLIRNQRFVATSGNALDNTKRVNTRDRWFTDSVTMTT
jgi:hypothetical protein